MRTILFISIYFLSGICWSQEIKMTQQLLNPSNKFIALSGYHGGLQVNAITQSSFPLEGSKGVRANAGADAYVHKIRTGIGFNLSRNEFGSGNFKETELAVHFAPKFNIRENFVLLTGIALNMNQANNRITPNSGFFSDNPFIKVRNTASWINGSIGAGIIVHQFLFLVEGRYITNSSAQKYFYNEFNPKLRSSFSFYLSNRFDINPDFSISPFAEFTLNQEPFDVEDEGFGVNTSFKSFQAGFKYLWNDGIAAQFGYNIKNSLLVSYAFYFNTNSLNYFGLHAHELGIRATLFNNKAKKVYYKKLGLL